MINSIQRAGLKTKTGQMAGIGKRDAGTSFAFLAQTRLDFAR